jgi:hypothetical protein
MWLFPLFRWFQALPPAAHWAAGIGTGLAAFWGWMTLRDRRRDKETTRKIEAKVEKENRRVEEAVDQADRDAVERLNSEQLRKLTERDPLNRGRAPRD